MFKPSSYQTAVFNFITNGKGDGVVEAVAGSGKTTTIVEASVLIPSSLEGNFIAFSKKIALELGRKLESKGSKMKASTIHSMMFGNLMRALRAKGANFNGSVEGNKTQRIARELINLHEQRMVSDDRDDLIDAVATLARHCMSHLVDPTNCFELDALIAKYDVFVNGWKTEYLSKYVAKVLEIDEQEALTKGIISFDDQLWLPIKWNTVLKKYDWLFVDECQDLSKLQLECVLRSRKAGGRILFVGDPKQAIMGFAGADNESVEQIVTRTKATRLPLSICYRCPSSHVALASSLVPQIEARENAPVGTIVDIKDTQVTSVARTGDLIICRVNAPLVDLAFQFIGMGIPAKVQGRQIGEQLVATIKRVVKASKGRFDVEALEAYRDESVDQLSRRSGDNEMKMQSIRDQVECLVLIYERSKPRTDKDFQAAVKALFEDNEDAPILLSTIHRAKGLEADRVILLHPHLVPHKMAKTAWQVEQEYNLQYVAYTRAKRELFFAESTKKRKSAED